MTNTENPTPTRPSRKAWWIGGAGIALALGLGAAALGVSIANADDDHDDRDNVSETSSSQPAPQPSNSNSVDDRLSESERASAIDAAIAEIGDGAVTDVDRGDDADHSYEVEITFADGRDVDVELDGDFRVVRVDSDN